MFILGKCSEGCTEITGYFTACSLSWRVMRAAQKSLVILPHVLSPDVFWGLHRNHLIFYLMSSLLKCSKAAQKSRDILPHFLPLWVFWGLHRNHWIFYLIFSLLMCSEGCAETTGYFTSFSPLEVFKVWKEITGYFTSCSSSGSVLRAEHKSLDIRPAPQIPQRSFIVQMISIWTHSVTHCTYII